VLQTGQVPLSLDTEVTQNHIDTVGLRQGRQSASSGVTSRRSATKRSQIVSFISTTNDSPSSTRASSLPSAGQSNTSVDRSGRQSSLVGLVRILTSPKFEPASVHVHVRSLCASPWGACNAAGGSAWHGRAFQVVRRATGNPRIRRRQRLWLPAPSLGVMDRPAKSLRVTRPALAGSPSPLFGTGRSSLARAGARRPPFSWLFRRADHGEPSVLNRSKSGPSPARTWIRTDSLAAIMLRS
jgi:hypothetical protein